MKKPNVFVSKSVIIPKTRAKWVSVNEMKHNVQYFWIIYFKFYFVKEINVIKTEFI